MLLTDAYQVLLEGAKATLKMGLIKDKWSYARKTKKWTEALEYKKQLGNYRDVSFDLIGEAGIGKTETVVAVGNELKIPVIVLMASQWVDNADLQGMPKVRVLNGREVTVNMIPEFFPIVKEGEDGLPLLREDGGLMVDYEAIADYIVNYEELYEYYNGDINQAPGCIIFFDELNRVVAEDVKNALLRMFVEKRLSKVSFPNPAFLVAANNPPTSEYSVSQMLSERAFLDRFCHIEVETNSKVVSTLFRKRKFGKHVVNYVETYPDDVNVAGEEYDLDIKNSSRSMDFVNSIVEYTDIPKMEERIFNEVIAGLIGPLNAINFVEITKKNAAIKVPNGEEIITDYDSVRDIVKAAAEDATEQDLMNKIKDNFINIITIPENVDALDLRGNLENVYNFFTDIHPEFRVQIIKEVVKLEKVHPVLAKHHDLFHLIKEDMANSNKK